MNGGRCQICGRRKGLKAGGLIVHHYVGGVPCAGAGAAPIELDDRELEAAATASADRWRAARDELAELKRRRANYIPPELERLEREEFPRMLKLGRRLERHRSWPARFAREMELRGYGTPAPQYLLDRGGLHA